MKERNQLKPIWNTIKIGQVAKIKSGRNQREVEVVDGKYPILGTGGEIGKTNSFLYNKPSVLIGRKGTIDKPKYIDTPFWTVDTLFYTDISDLILPKYLFYKFQTIDWRKYNEATGVPSLSSSVISNINITLPDLPYQQKIAKILSTIDGQIEKTEAIIAKYQSIKQGMLQDLFTRGIDVKTGKLRPKYEDSPELYKDSALGMLPKDWEVFSLECLGKTITGNTPSVMDENNYGEGFLFISPGDIHSDEYSIIETEKKLSTKGFQISRKLPAGSICVVCIGSTIGKIGITTKECCTNQQINSLIPFEKGIENYFYGGMTIYLTKQLYIKAGLQAVPIVNKSTFEKLYLPFNQNVSEMKLIDKALFQQMKVIEKEQLHLRKLKDLKQGLMNDLLSGKVEVTA